MHTVHESKKTHWRRVCSFSRHSHRRHSLRLGSKTKGHTFKMLPPQCYVVVLCRGRCSSLSFLFSSSIVKYWLPKRSWVVTGADVRRTLFLYMCKYMPVSCPRRHSFFISFLTLIINSNTRSSSSSPSSSSSSSLFISARLSHRIDAKMKRKKRQMRFDGTPNSAQIRWFRFLLRVFLFRSDKMRGFKMKYFQHTVVCRIDHSNNEYTLFFNSLFR